MNYQRLNRRSSEAGFGIISVLVGIGISSILAASLSQIFVNSLNGYNSVRVNTDREVLKQTLVSAVSCADSLTPTVCTTGSPRVVTLNRRTGSKVSTLVSNAGAGTKFGDWTVRAECNATNDGIILRSARLTADGTLTSTDAHFFKADPLTNKIVTWADKSSLMLGEGINVCSRSSSASSSATASSATDGYQIGGWYFTSSKYCAAVPNPMTGSTSCPRGFVAKNFGQALCNASDPATRKIYMCVK